MVEAPGTAPGSATLISQAVYRHSRLPDAIDISPPPSRRNPGRPRTPAELGPYVGVCAGPGEMMSNENLKVYLRRLRFGTTLAAATIAGENSPATRMPRTG